MFNEEDPSRCLTPKWADTIVRLGPDAELETRKGEISYE
jgi:hypothetical protein